MGEGKEGYYHTGRGIKGSTIGFIELLSLLGLTKQTRKKLNKPANAFFIPSNRYSGEDKKRGI